MLAAAVEREAPDLVLCGVQSSDAVNGATGIALAGHLGLPHVAVVKAHRLDDAGGSATVERELEGGLVEVLRVRTPALLTVQTGINEPRYATLRAIKQAKDKPLDVVEPGDLGLDADALAGAAGSRVRSLGHPEKGEGAEMLEGGRLRRGGPDRGPRQGAGGDERRPGHRRDAARRAARGLAGAGRRPPAPSRATPAG